MAGPHDMGPFFATASPYVNSYRDKALPIFFRKAQHWGHNHAFITKLSDTTMHQAVLSEALLLSSGPAELVAAVAGTTRTRIPARMRTAIVMLLSR